MSFIRAIPALLLIILAGCHSQPSFKSDKSLTPQPSGEVSYLVGVIGVLPEARYSLHQENLLIRPLGGNGTAQAQLRNHLLVRTPRDIRDGRRGIGSLFVIPLKPGRYELYNVHFQVKNVTMWRRESFSIPFQLEAGKAHYIGDFRGACADPKRACSFVHSYQLERDQALAARQHPTLPTLQPLALEQFDSAYPILLNNESRNLDVLMRLLTADDQ